MLIVPRERPLYSWLNLPDLRHLGGCYWSGQRTNITTPLHPQNSLGVQDYWCPLVDAISIYNLHRQLWFNAKNQVSLYTAFVWMCICITVCSLCVCLCVCLKVFSQRKTFYISYKQMHVNFKRKVNFYKIIMLISELLQEKHFFAFGNFFVFSSKKKYCIKNKIYVISLTQGQYFRIFADIRM